MARYVFKLPDVGEGVTESEIAAWRVSVGQVVQEDQPLVDMLTDKAAVEIPSPVTGVVLECRGAVGDRVAVGSALVILETAAARVGADAGEVDDAECGAPEGTASTPRAAPPPPALRLAPMAAPALRRRAREHGVDLCDLTGSGPRGRITQADLDAWLGAQAPSVVAGAAGERVEEVRIVGLRRRIADAMQHASQRIPHFTYVEETDVTELESLRAHLNAGRRAEQGRLSLLPFVMRALIRALAQHPQLNARYDDEAGVLRRHAAVHLGIAVQTPAGLTVPVLRHAERLDLWQSADAVRRLSGTVREHRARREDLSGSTITLSSLGAMGGIVSTPILNAPEVAIVGINRIVERPAFRNGRLVPRLTMNLSSSFDHRIVDGWDAAAFIQQIKTALEHPATLFMASAAEHGVGDA